MIDLLFRWVFGWVVVTIQGRSAEEVLSRIVLSGQRIWRVRRNAHGLTFSATLSGLESVRQSARFYRVKIHFGRRGGLPFKWRAIKRRPFLGVGVATAVFILFMGFSRVWVINVMGNMPANQKTALIRVAEQSGLQLGTAKGSLNMPSIRESMMKRLPRYSWIGIDIHGMVAIIQTVPIVRPAPIDHSARLVAARSGKVTDILVYMGDPVVSVGDTVRRGQTLIEGAVTGPVPDQSDPLTVKEARVETPAKGAVWANVRYTTKIFQPFRTSTFRPTGKRTTSVTFTFEESRPYLLWGWGGVPYAHFDVSKQVFPIRWAGVTFPAQVTKMIYNQTKEYPMVLRPRAALARATKIAEDHMATQLAQKGRVVRRVRKIRWQRTGVWVDLTWIVNQDIVTAPRGR